MTDTQLRDAAEAELRLTTLGWNKVKNYSTAQLATTHWGMGLAFLAQITQANAPVRDAAVVYLKKTTRGYSADAANWKAAFAELAKITDAPPPPPSGIYPALTLYPSEVSP